MSKKVTVASLRDAARSLLPRRGTLQVKSQKSGVKMTRSKAMVLKRDKLVVCFAPGGALAEWEAIGLKMTSH